MKIHFRTFNNRVTVELEAETPKDLFAKLAEFQEVFDSERACRICGCADLRFVVRTVTKGSKKYKYHELRCTEPKCRARFSFGEAMEPAGALFPRRKDDSGYLPDGGWLKYNKDTQDHTSGPYITTASKPAEDKVPF